MRVLKLFGSHRPGATSGNSITGGTFTLTLTMPSGQTVTTAAIAFNATPGTLATNISAAINAAAVLGNTNLSGNTTGVAGVSVTTSSAANANPLVFNIEMLFRTGVSPDPVERTLLTTAALDFAMRSLRAGGKRLEDPALRVRYRPPEDSGFFRGGFNGEG